MGAMKISYISLLVYLLLLAIPIAILVYLKLKIVGSLLVSALRMILQLALVGLYLEYIFKWDNPLLNSLWILVMIVVANQSILRQSGLKFRVFFLYTMPAFIITMLFSFVTFLIVFDITTFISARYLIPIGGMVMGNMLRGNVVSLDRFYHSLTQREEEYIYYISLGCNQAGGVITIYQGSITVSTLTLPGYFGYDGVGILAWHDDRPNFRRRLSGGGDSIPGNDHDCYFCVLSYFHFPGNDFFLNPLH